MIHISYHNTKLGYIANISLPPVITCDPQATCFKDCYAQKCARQYTKTKAAWEENLVAYQQDPDYYFRTIKLYRSKYFRFHVGGDCPTQDYADRIKLLAKSKPETNYMLFTKRYDWFSPEDLTENLSIIYSAWPYSKLPPKNGISVAYIRSDLRSLNSLNPFTCTGLCEYCLRCWHTYNNEVQIILKPH